MLMGLSSPLEDKKLAVIGVGAMGSALVRGLIQSGKVKPEQIIAADIDPSKLAGIQALGIPTTDDNKSAVQQSEIVLLCVKPQVMDDVLADIAPVTDPKSIASFQSLRAFQLPA
jgi:pyrroline-5-carboxylate reductase